MKAQEISLPKFDSSKSFAFLKNGKIALFQHFRSSNLNKSVVPIETANILLIRYLRFILRLS